LIRARVIAAGFVIGGAFHLRDIVAGGWMPYRFAPDAMNLFWTMLLPLDLIAAGLILWRRGRRMGVVLGLAIMAADLSVNGHAWGQMGIAAFGPALTIQGAFALLLAAWAPSLWHSASTSPISRA
jgi:membrane protein HdeD